jgi:hypothetical protein
VRWGVGSNRRTGIGGAWLLGLWMCGCFSPSAEAVASLEQVKADGLKMGQSLSALEDRFLANQSRVLLWKEMANRHESVSAVACDNANTHAVAMMKYEQKQKGKLRQKRLAKNTVVSRNVLTGGGGEGLRTGRF